MSEIGVVLRVPQGTHAKLKAGCAKNDRSMQKVLVALIEGWVANGAPDPSTYGQPQEKSTNVDAEAREGLVRLGKEFKKLNDRITALEAEKARNKGGRDAMSELYNLLNEAEAEDPPSGGD